MSQEPLVQLLDNDVARKIMMLRLVNAGIDLPVAENAMNNAAKERNWYSTLIEVGHTYRKLGEDALAATHDTTAGEYFLKAALGYHFAQLAHFHDLEEKEYAIRLKIAVGRKAHSLVKPAITELTADFEGVDLPVQVRLPAGPGPHCAVIIICGMDSTKEETFYFQNYLLARGLAVVGFDGPGQGQVWRHMKMRSDFHKAVSAVADRVSGLPEVNSDRWGLLGQSFGGLLAPTVLAHDKRFRAGAINGGFFDLTALDWENPIRRTGLAFLFGVETEAEARSLAESYSLADCIATVAAPIMVIHGRFDKDDPSASSRRIVEESPGGGRFVEFPDVHMCPNHIYHVRPIMADFLADHLAKA